jgi:ABC-type transporter Mla subunit MlaD
MSAKTNNFRIGLFALGAITLLVIGLLAFGARSYFAERTRFETAIPGEVYGLSVGSRVELRGVPIGQVTAINFVWNVYPRSKTTFIIVEFEVEDRVMPVPAGAERHELIKAATERGLRAMVKAQAITGTSLLALENLDPESYPPPRIDFAPRESYIPSAPGQFTRMLEAIERSLHNIEQVNLASISEGVTNALASATQFTEKLNRLDLQALTTDASALLAEAKSAGVKLQAAVDEVRETIRAMKLETVGQNADGLLAGLRDTNAKLQNVLDHADALPLKAALADIRQAVETLNAVLLELKQYPSGFIFGKPPPPAKSVQPPQK